jgi:hypothetical protein
MQLEEKFALTPALSLGGEGESLAVSLKTRTGICRTDFQETKSFAGCSLSLWGRVRVRG